MPSETHRTAATSWQSAVRKCIAATGAGALGVVAPIWLAFDLAVGPGEALRDGKMHNISLGTAPTDQLPVQPREISALNIAPQNIATLTRVFSRYDYTMDNLTAEQAGVPPIFVRSFPDDWRTMEDAKQRKALFIKTVLPLILKANAEIRVDRKRMLALIREAKNDPENLSDGGRYWLNKLAKRYKIDNIDFDALRARVDVVPASLALAQAANESGWGTSRFARQGNALFGQWTWDTSQGIQPKELQQGKGNYAVRKFDSLGQSVSAYMLNLNTHNAYAPMRKRRETLRDAGKSLSGSYLAGGLKSYSQRGNAYIEEIRSMISYNEFQRFDGLTLGDAALG